MIVYMFSQLEYFVKHPHIQLCDGVYVKCVVQTWQLLLCVVQTSVNAVYIRISPGECAGPAACPRCSSVPEGVLCPS